MTTETSSIDDVLTGSKTPLQPATPEYAPEVEEVNYDAPDDALDEPEDGISLSDNDNEEPEESKRQTDEYGNEKSEARVYTEDEVNERINKAIRDRLSRMKSQEQTLPNSQQVQQAQQGFNYDADSDVGWQQQLESFVEQTFNKISQRQSTAAQQQKEARAQSEFEDKFVAGMERFQDFRDVVGAQPITDAMTYALRGMKDPAAFVYAASKRHAPEISRISQIQDPYAQMVEMGKLEERMRKASSGTSAPRPIARNSEDAGMPQAKKKDEGDSIENLIAKSEAKKMAKLKLMRSGR